MTGGWPVTVTEFDPDGKLKTATVVGKTCTVGLVSSTGWTRSLTVGNVLIDRVRHPSYGEVSSITAKYNGTPLYTASYPNVDGLGRIKTKTETGTPSVSYEYDAEGRLWKVGTTEYLYDANGNRTNANTSYDARDRIISSNGVTYAYNAAGELTNKSDGTSYTYDRRGQLTGATVSGQAVTYELDAMGRRVGRSAVGGFTARRYLYGAGAQPLAQLSMAGAVEAQYVYLTGRHAPDVMIKSGVVYALVTDHLGSVRMVVNVDTGVVAQRISYDAWGNASYEVGTWDVQPFGFAGGLYDPLTKLVHFGAREYDAVTGRWTRADPILFAGGDANLYAYVGNDPVNFVDPSGLVIGGGERLLQRYDEYGEGMDMWAAVASGSWAAANQTWNSSGGFGERLFTGVHLGSAVSALALYAMVGGVRSTLLNPIWIGGVKWPGGCPADASKLLDKGRGPRGVARIDAPENGIPGSQWHAHSGGKGSAAVNVDGTAHHGDNSWITSPIREFLRAYGWNL